MLGYASNNRAPLYCLRMNPAKNSFDKLSCRFYVKDSPELVENTASRVAYGEPMLSKEGVKTICQT